jgi:glutathione S-transferase
MKGTVVSFGRQGKSTVVKLEQSPRSVAGILETRRITIPPLNGSDSMARGQELMRLLGRHRPVRDAIGDALAQQQGTENLYFHVQTDSADELPWELLYQDSVGFCALDSRWPVGRIAREYREVHERGYRNSLKFVAVLSAAKRSGVPQLRSLLGVVDSSRGRELNLRLHVISGEKAVLDAAAAAKESVTVEELEPDPAKLETQIADAQPDVLHLLCHGGFTAKIRTLAFATAADFAAKEPTGMVRLKVADVVKALAKCNPWLVVLAACQSAEATDGFALAHALAERGIPAVIGMRRLVDIADTDRFCAALYPQVIRTISDALRPNRAEVLRELDWAAALTGPRKALSGDNPALLDSWSDPVLYVQRDALKVYREGNAPMTLVEFNEVKAELDQWNAFRATLDPDTTPTEVIQGADARIAALRAQLSGVL